MAERNKIKYLDKKFWEIEKTLTCENSGAYDILLVQTLPRDKADFSDSLQHA